LTAPDRLRLLVATYCGLGHFPFAPGTVGSLATLPLIFLLWRLGGSPAVVAGAVVAALAGYATAGAAAKKLGRPDPGPVVIDEVAGQFVALLFFAPTPTALVTGFLLFRLFDIWKPAPVRQAERLPGGSGIMTDDLVAGLYANLVHQLLRWGLPSLWGSG
jgi:phosphatidylglycerophosphatase A